MGPFVNSISYHIEWQSILAHAQLAHKTHGVSAHTKPAVISTTDHKSFTIRSGAAHTPFVSSTQTGHVHKRCQLPAQLRIKHSQPAVGQ